MMAAYQPAPSGHPGLPHGHPGMAQNPGQHMGQAMMHPGVSGAPHVSQPGAMMGMQPGAGMVPGGMAGQHPGSGMAMQAQMSGTMAGGMPGGQAMSHGMTPQQMHQQQQQQQAHLAQMQQNPQLAMQHQQMRLRQQQMLAQQQAHMQGMPQGVQLTPAQLQQFQQQQSQMQQGGQVQLPAHLMQQQMQLQRAQAQQMAQQQHAQQQQQQQNHMAQQLAMQHANSQQSNQGQSGPQNPQNAQGQPTNPQQIRPPSRIANPNEQGQPSNQPQQHLQQAQGQPGQPQPQQTPQQGQQPTPLQQQQAMAMQQQRIALMHRSQQAHQHMRQMQAQGQAQQAQPTAGGVWILRLMNFGDHLTSFNAGNGKDMAGWHNFVERHFAAEGRLVHTFDDSSNPNGGTLHKVYEVLRPTLPRYFWTFFDSGAHSLRLHTENAREVSQPNGMFLVTCQSAILSVSYPNGARLEMSGALHVLFSAESHSIECFRFETSGTEEILSRGQIEKVLADYSPIMPSKTSPKMNKKALPKAQQKMQDQQDRLTIDHFPKTPKGTIGITSKVQQFLEIGETMNVMSDLMQYAQEKKMRPEQALEALVAQYESQPNGGNPQINYPQNGSGPDLRTTNMQSMQMTQNGQIYNNSPSVANLNLPMQANGMNGSPHIGNNPGNLAPAMGMMNSHTPSPHQSNMAAPSMMPQHSQQGTNSSVASANTSPNVNNNNNKRRRSTVKLEGEDSGGLDGNQNQNRVKPSPRMSKKAKPQG